MPFLTRARTIYDRGNTVAAAIALVEGLKRDPSHSEAFNWLIDLYCNEIDHTGLEEDLVSVLNSCPDPEGAYRYIYQRLLRVDRERFVRRLDRARRDVAARQGLDIPTWEEVLRQHEQERREPVKTPPSVDTAPEEPRSVDESGPDTGSMRAAVENTLRPTAGRVPIPVGGPQLGNKPPMPVSGPVTPLPAGKRKAWHDDVHPALLAAHAAQQVELEVSVKPKASIAAPGAKSSGGKMVKPRAVPDPDAVKAFRPVKGGMGGRSSGAGLGREARLLSKRGERSLSRRAKPVRRSSKGKKAQPSKIGRKVLRGVLITAGLLLIGLAFVRLWTVAERRQAVAGASASVERFEPPLLQQAEMRLVEALEDDKESLELSGRLVWTRSLRRYVTSPVVGAASPEDEGQGELPEQVMETSWGLGAQLLDALGQDNAEQAQPLLASLTESVEAGGSFPEPVLLWLSAETALASGDVGKALEFYNQGMEEESIPAMVGAIDAHMRRGNVVSARKVMSALRKLAPEHAAVPVGEVALDHIRRLVEDPRGAILKAPESLELAQLNAASMDRRLEAWVVMAAPEFATKRELEPDAEGHPVLKLIYARQAFGDGRIKDAALEIAAFDKGGVETALQQAGQEMFTGGFGEIGRPDVALDHVPGPSVAGEVGAEIFAKKNPKAALERSALLADLGRYEDSRQLLKRLLGHPKLGAEARVVALRMHLSEGRSEDVERHISRLKRHRGALVAGAALDLYRNRASGAASRLGPTTPQSLPDPEEQPHLRRFEIRVRLLALAALGHDEQVRVLLQDIEVPAALRARVLGPTKGETLRHKVLSANPTRLDDLVDLAVALLDADEPAEAADAARQIIKAVPTHTEAHRLLGFAMMKMGKGKGAMKHLQASSAGREGQPQVDIALAEAMYHSGQQVRALHMVMRHLDRQPNDVRALKLLGKAYRATNRFTAGKRDLENRYKKINVKKERQAAGEICYHLALLYKAQFGTEEGVKWLDKAKRHLGDRPDVMLARADHLRARGQGEKAFELYQKLSELDGVPQRVHLQLGRYALKQGKKGLAKVSLERYLKGAPEGDSADWARRQVEQLGKL